MCGILFNVGHKKTGYSSYFPGVKQQGNDVNLPHPSTTELKIK
jgi:hypothetical protein